MPLMMVFSGLWPAIASADAGMPVNAPRYDQDYPVIGYSGPATHNRVWRLKQQLEAGAVKLEWEPKQGYLRSLLRALEIDPDSQVLVFSRTSLQTRFISEKTPRAIYFNDDTYVGWIQGSPLIEFTVIDAAAGVVFFGLENLREQAVSLEREGGRCLTCHDTYSMMGGGVPRVLAMSSPVDDPLDTRTNTSASEVDDRTPIEHRWGGWYVTGRRGAAAHFGNLPLREEHGGEQLRKLVGTRANRESVDGYFDASGYLTNKSDIAALLVLEHQSYVQNLITRANYKVRTIVARGRGAADSWAALDRERQAAIRPIIEPVVRAMFFADAVKLNDIEGIGGYTARFSRSGPLDSRGRTLRELDLHKRLFRYPLSFLVYSEHFDALPSYVLDYIDSRIAEVLQGRDTTGLSARISAADRAAITQILIDTKPRLASRLQGQGAVSARP
ncbi:MAG: hypothetical protein ABI645_11280 [Pseudomonadota bacterium]